MLKGKVAEFTYDFSSLNKEAESGMDTEFSAPKTLSASVKYMNDVQEIYTDSFVGFTTNFEVANKKVRQIVQKLARAIDENSVDEVKSLKAEYGDCAEFGKAKKLLNEKCKTVWNVFEITEEKIPQEAMKTLGISNIPSLDFLLGNTIKYFEKDNCQTTSRIIESILNNDNMRYTIEDIHNYLISKNAKLNYNTVKYLIEKHHYNKNKLQELKAAKSVIDKALKNTTFKNSAKFCIESTAQAIFKTVSAIKNLKTV
ncbi:hypothetical protein IJ596_08460 [bacterium]|nr:hypothetical protein [bacterium]